MKNNKSTLLIIGMILICLLSFGCKDILVSGTFIIVKTIISFTAQSGFYFYQVDITDDPDWEDHHDKIDFVDAVGVEFYITSTEPGDVTFNAFITPLNPNYSNFGPYPSAVPGSATQIIEDFTVSPGVTHITYKQSLGFLRGLDSLKTYSEIGQFDYYGQSTGNDGSTFLIDSAKVIVTFSASD